jgi:dGTPase
VSAGPYPAGRPAPVAPYDDRDRERMTGEAPPSGQRGVFERDRARVLHSAALRRLAGKTQVMGVDAGDFPRTRLTHSLECAQIGRELAESLGADPDLVDAACLAHDLGHPPFGHNGETALHEVAAGCGGFEGNAQSFRVLTRLEVKVLDTDGRSAGLNLTRATLDAATKYPWPRRDGEVKWGAYDDDLATFAWVRDGVEGTGRCAEAQIMDWSDDVAYSVHDLEDGIHAGHVPPTALGSADVRQELAELASTYAPLPIEELAAAGERLWGLPMWLRGYDGGQPSLAALKAMTSGLIGRLCRSAMAATRAATDRPLRRHTGQLVVPVGQRAECAILKSLAARFVMSRAEALLAQARQREQLAELAEALLAGAPQALEPWLREAWSSAADDAARTRVVVDQVASLTDVSALALHRRLVG